MDVYERIVKTANILKKYRGTSISMIIIVTMKKVIIITIMAIIILMII